MKQWGVRIFYQWYCWVTAEDQTMADSGYWSGLLGVSIWTSNYTAVLSLVAWSSIWYLQPPKQGTSGKAWRYFSLSQLEKVLLASCEVEAEDAAKHPMMHRTAPSQSKNHPAKNVVPKLRSPALGRREVSAVLMGCWRKIVLWLITQFQQRISRSCCSSSCT